MAAKFDSEYCVKRMETKVIMFFFLQEFENEILTFHDRFMSSCIRWMSLK